MKFAMWAYPWDLLDEGVEETANRLQNLGIDEINLATNYHHVQTFLPHNPERRTFFARASSYFQPGDEYERLEPIPNETMDGEDWLDHIDNELAETDIGLNSWTIGCHNSRLGMNHPDMTLTSPYGDDLVFGLCPSNPEVQAYLKALLADLDMRASFDKIELETFDYFYGTGFGWHHDKYHTQLGTLGEFLFGLCFCDHCRVNAADAGVDVETARARTIDTLDAIVEGELPHDINLAGWLMTHPTVVEYIEVRIQTLADVYADLEATVTDAELGAYLGFFGVEDAWMHGIDPNELAAYLDFYTVIAYESTPDAVRERLRIARQLTSEAGIPLDTGILPSHPAIHDRQTIADIVDAVAEFGTRRVSFYNYGLLPERNLKWVGAATSPHQ